MSPAELQILADLYEYLDTGALADVSEATMSKLGRIANEDAAKIIFLLQVVKP